MSDSELGIILVPNLYEEYDKQEVKKIRGMLGQKGPPI